MQASSQEAETLEIDQEGQPENRDSEYEDDEVATVEDLIHRSLDLEHSSVGKVDGENSQIAAGSIIILQVSQLGTSRNNDKGSDLPNEKSDYY